MLHKLNDDFKETWVPVAKLIIFLTLVAVIQLFTDQIDLRTVFLNAVTLIVTSLHDHVEVILRLPWIENLIQMSPVYRFSSSIIYIQ